jgi:hypothetical protein
MTLQKQHLHAAAAKQKSAQDRVIGRTVKKE